MLRQSGASNRQRVSTAVPWPVKAFRKTVPPLVGEELKGWWDGVSRALIH